MNKDGCAHKVMCVTNLIPLVSFFFNGQVIYDHKMP
jgi:hypothetical protein